MFQEPTRVTSPGNQRPKATGCLRTDENYLVREPAPGSDQLFEDPVRIVGVESRQSAAMMMKGIGVEGRD